MGLGLLISVHSITSLEDEKRAGFYLILGRKVNVWGQVCYHILLFSLYRGLGEMQCTFYPRVWGGSGHNLSCFVAQQLLTPDEREYDIKRLST